GPSLPCCQNPITAWMVCNREWLPRGDLIHPVGRRLRNLAPAICDFYQRRFSERVPGFQHPQRDLFPIGSNLQGAGAACGQNVKCVGWIALFYYDVTEIVVFFLQKRFNGVEMFITKKKQYR